MAELADGHGVLGFRSMSETVKEAKRMLIERRKEVRAEGKELDRALAGMGMKRRGRKPRITEGTDGQPPQAPPENEQSGPST
jgi:hypothetical protein